MHTALKPLLDSRCLSLLLEVLRLLSLLRRRGAPVQAKLEGLALECLLALVSASAAAASQLLSKDRDQSGLLVRPASSLLQSQKCSGGP